MGKIFPELDGPLRAWIAAQHVFFVATAPGGDDGHINCSPKGLDSFRILDPTTVAYLDYAGSGVETIAHVRDNGRILIMFCSFQGPTEDRATVRPRNDHRAARPGVRGVARSL